MPSEQVTGLRRLRSAVIPKLPPPSACFPHDPGPATDSPTEPADLPVSMVRLLLAAGRPRC